MDIDPNDFSGIVGLQTFRNICEDRASAGDVETLRSFLLTKAARTYEKHDIPRIAAGAMLGLGTDGVRQLVGLVREAPGAIYPLAILETLWRASEGRPVPRSSLGAEYKPSNVSPQVQEAARLAIDDLIVESQFDGELSRLVLDLQHSDMLTAMGSEDVYGTGGGPSPFALHVTDVIRDSSIILTARLIEEFAGMLEAKLPELRYQEFLEANPVFIDPLAAEILNRHRLGADLITDFVIRRHDWRYVMVEIEKPQDRILNAAGDFSAIFSHAMGQVLDFQGWASSHVEYARTRMPSIENPAGLLIIGRRSSLGGAGEEKLRRWCANSRSIEVLTYDDIVDRARLLYASLRRLPTPG